MQNPKIFTISHHERATAIDTLIDQSSARFDFYLLLILSILIVVPGLFLNNPAIIIGAMVVAPLMNSVLSLALGITLADFNLILRSIKTVAFAFVLIGFFAVIMSLFYHGAELSGEILSRSQTSLSYLLVAMASGIAASFALVRPNLSATLPGIAVSVSLLPPMAVTGIGIGFGDLSLVTGSLLLVAVNMIGIVFSAIVIFNLFGFYTARTESERKLEEENGHRN